MFIQHYLLTDPFFVLNSIQKLRVIHFFLLITLTWLNTFFDFINPMSLANILNPIGENDPGKPSSEGGGPSGGGPSGGGPSGGDPSPESGPDRNSEEDKNKDSNNENKTVSNENNPVSRENSPESSDYNYDSDDSTHSNQYKELADRLVAKKEEMLEHRRSIGATSKAATFTDLGVSFHPRTWTAQQDGALVRNVFPNIYGKSSCNDSVIETIRNFRPPRY